MLPALGAPLPVSPYISLHLQQEAPDASFSLYLPTPLYVSTSPYTSLHLQAHASLEEDEELDEEALLDFAPQLGAS